MDGLETAENDANDEHGTNKWAEDS